MAEYYEREKVIEFIRSYRHSTDVAFHMEEHLNEIPAADVRPVVLCKDCCLYGKCATEDVFRFAGLEEDNRFCGAGRIKRNAATDGEARRLRKQLTLNELGYSYDFPNREG